MKALLLICFLITVLCISSSWQKETLSADIDICRLFKDGRVLRKPGFCDRGIKCENLKSVDGTLCMDTKKFFNKKSAKCVESVSDKYCKSPCTKSSNKYVKDKKNCEGWYQCNGAVMQGNGYCPYNMHFDAKQQLCMYPEQTSCTATYDFCDVVNSGIPFKDENNCHKYFKCTSSLTGSAKLTSYTCDLGMYYDVQTEACIAKAQVDCYKHPYPENVCGTQKLPLRNRFVDDNATCRGYFFCTDPGSSGKPNNTPAWGQCTAGEFFDEGTQTCRHRAHVNCNEDRCDGAGTGRALSDKSGCQHYLECENNYTISENYCGDGLYFDDDLRQCTNQRRNYPACS